MDTSHPGMVLAGMVHAGMVLGTTVNKMLRRRLRWLIMVFCKNIRNDSCLSGFGFSEDDYATMMDALTFYKKRHPSSGARDNRNTTPPPEADTRTDRNDNDRGTLPSKLIPFDSNQVHLETCFERLENFTIHYKWNEENRLFYMKNSLGKDIGTVLWDNGPTTTNELIALLRSRFGEQLHIGFGEQLLQQDRMRHAGIEVILVEHPRT